jgi:CRISPR-associated protein Csb2
MKAVRPTWLRGGDSVSYLWPLTEPLHQEVIEHVETLGDMARHVVALGWGIDLVVGHCAVISQAEIAELPGERWLPVDVATTGGLRVPIPGTLDDLTRRHRAALNRLRRNTLTPLPQLSAYGTTAYRRATDPQPREVAALSLLKLDGSGFRPFDTVRRSLTVAGMTRHAAKRAAASAGWAAERINAFVLGHGDSEQEAQHVPVGGSRLAFLPLPTIEGRGEAKARVAGSIRRVCLTAFGDTCRQEIAWARRALSGMELLDEQTGAAVALLATPPANDRTLRQYVGAATTWTTVTPVVLPGYDDPKHYRRRLKQGVEAEEQKKLLARLDDRTDALLRKAIVQAGHPQALAAHAELEWRKVGFLRGVDLASRYGVPAHLESFPRLHVRIRWRDELGNPVQVPGPICLGGGRFYGLGLFVSVRDEA